VTYTFSLFQASWLIGLYRSFDKVRKASAIISRPTEQKLDKVKDVPGIDKGSIKSREYKYESTHIEHLKRRMKADCKKQGGKYEGSRKT